MRRTKYVLNGNAGAFVNILSTLHARYVRIIEDDAAAATGLQAKYPEDNFTAIVSVSAVHEPIEIGNKVSIGNNAGAILGTPGYATGTSSSVPQTTYCQLRGNGAGATTVWVEEHE